MYFSKHIFNLLHFIHYARYWGKLIRIKTYIYEKKQKFLEGIIFIVKSQASSRHYTKKNWLEYVRCGFWRSSQEDLAFDMDSVQWIWQCLAVIEEKRTPKRGSIIWQGKRDLKGRFIKEALYSYVKVPRFYSQGKKGFIRRISTRKMIWLILHVREKTGRDRLIVCQIWWSCSLF